MRGEHYLIIRGWDSSRQGHVGTAASQAEVEARMIRAEQRTVRNSGAGVSLLGAVAHVSVCRTNR